jgi:hypothetical protein
MGGQVVPSSYRASPRHQILSSNGFFRLAPDSSRAARPLDRTSRAALTRGASGLGVGEVASGRLLVRLASGTIQRITLP